MGDTGHAAEWAEGYKAGYAAAYGEGYQAGLAAGRAGLYADQHLERKLAKREAKNAKREAKYAARLERERDREAARARFLATSNPGRTAPGTAQSATGSTAAPAPAPRSKGRRAQEATIVGKEQISPDMVRLRALAPELIGREFDYTDHYIKILFVPDGAPYSWPFDLAEIKRSQPKHLRPVTRTYTLRSVDSATGEIEIDFVLHGDSGLAGPWARDVEVGQTFAFLGPGGGWAPTAKYDHFVLAGDESAAPAIAAALERIPAGSSAVAFIEVEAAGHEIPLPTGEDIEVRFVYREGAMPGSVLSDAVRSYTPPPGHVGWFVHGVAEMIKALRRHLFVAKGVSKRDASISGYWRLRMTEDQWQESKREFVAALEAEEEAAAREP
ncbi:siderophore-interacting protein [Corynebacterium lizhenjunii]|uniref:Siderophore-interacting protein n=1 Tax=Corynebacterium lizhenjunii TaxID=2709394 RepID=A0A7T0KGL0_9CORY|nr:siderophore-interacting protein [Corynebacterium lizhenjunii]